MTVPMEILRRKKVIIPVVGAMLAVLLVCAGLAGTLVWQVRFRQPPLINGDVAFETLERDRAPDAPGLFFPREEPGLIVLTSDADIQPVSRYVNGSAVQHLRALDWDTHFALVVFRGWQADSVGEFRLERLVRQDGDVSVYASTGPIGEEHIATSPYHVVAVRKVGQWSGLFTFRYYLDDTGEVATVTHAIAPSTFPIWP